MQHSVFLGLRAICLCYFLDIKMQKLYNATEDLSWIKLYYEK